MHTEVAQNVGLIGIIYLYLGSWVEIRQRRSRPAPRLRARRASTRVWCWLIPTLGARLWGLVVLALRTTAGLPQINILDARSTLRWRACATVESVRWIPTRSCKDSRSLIRAKSKRDTKPTGSTSGSPGNGKLRTASSRQAFIVSEKSDVSIRGRFGTPWALRSPPPRCP